MKRHSWNGKIKGGLKIVGCKNCPCVKELINGKITYFLNDNITDKAPDCEQRITVDSSN